MGMKPMALGAFKQVIRVSVKYQTISIVVLVVFPLIYSIQGADAYVTRGCQAWLFIEVQDAEDAPGMKGATHIIDNFIGRGQCKNQTLANECRENARDRIKACMNDLIESRHQRIAPLTCAPAEGNSVGIQLLGPFLDTRNKRGPDVKFHVDYASCCALAPQATAMTVDLKLHIGGPPDKNPFTAMGALKGCGHSQVLMEDYFTNCTRQRDLGLCR